MLELLHDLRFIYKLLYHHTCSRY